MNRYHAGIDIGSVSLSFVVIDNLKNIVSYDYIIHEGKIKEKIRFLIEKYKDYNIKKIAITSSSKEFFTGGVLEVDNKLSIIEGVKYYYPNVKSILHVGGEKFFLLMFDENGNYKDMKMSTSCAAGTGAFLDQQAKRLNLKDTGELAYLASQNKTTPPKIASRCSVFAKSDLIHAQQEGYTLSEICDGLCLGLANNICDTLFSEKSQHKIVFTGGVSKNIAVAKYIEKKIGNELIVNEHSHIIGALGAALISFNKYTLENISFDYSIINDKVEDINYYYKPLKLTKSVYPDFSKDESYIYLTEENIIVEVDIYKKDYKKGAIYLGIDIGSTSTKAIVIDTKKEPIIGLYTRTSGKPLKAVSNLFKAYDDATKKYEWDFEIVGVGTTGSGRKFIGKIIGADIILDEISAHAKAAYELNPEIDTIIEIGGQDSKFTTLKNGVVNFSKMNAVCAAGTGSFIEEQAYKLGVKLADIPELIKDAEAPLTSDRCTVFMERDINYYLSKNYPLSSCLAAVMHAVRDNYLSKVAVTGAIGNNICFQGATAKNISLVAAFEQKLNKPIYVSKYCHLTGALGVALTVYEEFKDKTSFRGLDIFKQEIPIKTEICKICHNNCHLSIVEIGGNVEVFGLLCGRDYESKKREANKETLIELRKKVYNSEKIDKKILGIPCALQIYDELFFWKNFFEFLEIPIYLTENLRDPVSIGKMYSKAEFCAPMLSYHGHIVEASKKADVVFLPIYLEDKPDNPDVYRKYCFYSQFSAQITCEIPYSHNRKVIMPVINRRKGDNFILKELFNEIYEVYGESYSYERVKEAYENAMSNYKNYKNKLKSLYKKPENNEIKIAILGRPYTALAYSMNKNILNIFANLNIETYFQDMLPELESYEYDELYKIFYWNYASQILKATEFCAKEDGLYPVLITSFKCSPDSFVIEYFTRIMDKHQKPYLILQLDDHDSSVGYETRVEAAIRAFKNHRINKARMEIKNFLPIVPSMDNKIGNKTIIFPDFEPFVFRMIVDIFKNAGYDARLLEEKPYHIIQGMKTNTGQCIPLNALVEEYIEYLKKYDLNPEKTLLWIPKAKWACNIGLYPYYIKSLLEAHGNGIEKAGVYFGDITFAEFNPAIILKVFFAYMFGGFLSRITSSIRPYEINKGETDKIAQKSLELFINSLRGNIKYENALKQSCEWFYSIPYKKTYKPKIAIFGDVYVRENKVFNQNLVEFIENNGGEAIITPYIDYLKIVSSAFFIKIMNELDILNFIKFRTLMRGVEFIESRIYNALKDYLEPPIPFEDKEVMRKLSAFDIRIEQDGETIDNILKAYYVVKRHPDLTLFVHTSPAFCCPSIVTESLINKMEKIFNVPIVNVIYDGTNSFKNDVIIPYIHYAIEKHNKETRVNI